MLVPTFVSVPSKIISAETDSNAANFQIMESEYKSTVLTVKTRDIELFFSLTAALVVLTVIRVAGPLRKSQYNNKILLVLFRE